MPGPWSRVPTRGFGFQHSPRAQAAPRSPSPAPEVFRAHPYPNARPQSACRQCRKVLCPAPSGQRLSRHRRAFCLWPSPASVAFRAERACFLRMHVAFPLRRRGIARFRKAPRVRSMLRFFSRAKAGCFTHPNKRVCPQGDVFSPFSPRALATVRPKRPTPPTQARDARFRAASR